MARVPAIASSFGSAVFAGICILTILRRYQPIALVVAAIRVRRTGDQMFIQFKKLKNESGIVLFIVLMTAIIIMVFSVGILTQSMNESNYAQQQIDQIVADQYSKGVFWNAYSNSYLATGTTSDPSSSTIAGRIYQSTLSTTAQVNQWNLSTNYDTFQ